MFLSLCLIVLGGMAAGALFTRLKLPALLGMLLLGIVLGKSCLNILDPSIMSISKDLRQIALLIILIRAGLGLNGNDLKKVGRPAILMSFVPAAFEIIGCALLGPALLGLSLAESLLLGSVLGAISPAVVVPGMLKLMEQKRGTGQSIPQLILAGASADDIFCLVLFACFTSLAASGSFDIWTLLRLPTSIVFGAAGGIAVGWMMCAFFERIPVTPVGKVMIMMGISFFLVWLESVMEGVISFSGLLAVIAASMVIAKQDPGSAKSISSSMSSLWQAAQLFLFVLVGAVVDVQAVYSAGLIYIVLIFGAMFFRMAGVYICMAGSALSKNERIFCMLAYTPKATVQAAVGAIPLSMGLACGPVVLSLSVLAILITAPFGAIAIEKTSSRLLKQEEA